MAIGLGANLDDPRGAIRRAAADLAAGGLEDRQLSGFWVTAPEDCVPGTPDFVNAAVIGSWRGSAPELRALCKEIELRAGRPAAHSSREARVVDLDLLLFGNQEIHLPELTVPHPRLRQRRFALAPLAELAPDWRLPPDGITVAEALRSLG